MCYFVILLLSNEMQMSVRRFSAIPHLGGTRKVYYGVARWLDGLSVALTGEPPSQLNKYT